MTIGQSSGNHHGLGYTSVGNTIATSSKTMFVKVAPPIVFSLVSGKTLNPLPFGGKVKGFVLIFHYCNMTGHIRPSGFKYLNTFRMNRLVESFYKPELHLRTKSIWKIILLREFGLKIKSKLLYCLYFIKDSFY